MQPDFFVGFMFENIVKTIITDKDRKYKQISFKMCRK